MRCARAHHRRISGCVHTTRRHSGYCVAVSAAKEVFNEHRITSYEHIYVVILISCVRARLQHRSQIVRVIAYRFSRNVCVDCGLYCAGGQRTCLNDEMSAWLRLHRCLSVAEADDRGGFLVTRVSDVDATRCVFCGK